MSSKKTPPAKANKAPKSKKKSHPATPPLETAIGAAPVVEIPEEREDIQAPYHFTTDEIQTMNVGLRTALDEIDMLKEQAKAAAQDFKLRIQNRSNEAKGFRNKLASGEETRALKAAVAYNAKTGVKTYLHPETGAFIRDETMQPADYQLPMFKEQAPADEKAEKPAGTPKSSKPPKSSPAGETSVGDAMDKAAAGTKAPLFLLDLSKEDWAPQALTNAFKKSAKLAGWSAPQISALNDRLKEAASVEAMIDTLRPFTIAPEDSTVEVSGVSLPRLQVAFEPGFSLEKYAPQFRKAAKGAGWPEAAIDEVVHEAERQARVIGDEPEATEAGMKHLRNFVFIAI